MPLKLAAAFVSALALTASAPQTPVLGWDRGERVLAWYDPASLTAAPKPRLSYQSALCSWSFSRDRSRLAISDCDGSLRIFDVRRMRRLGTVSVSGRIATAQGVAWLRRDRALLLSHVGADGTMLVTVDPVARRVLRRVDLGGVAGARTIVGERIVFLVSPPDRFGPPRVVVAGADGSVHSATIDRISAGTVITDDATPHAEVREPGFAVDPAGRAFVIAPDLTVAEVDLDTMAVAYHAPVRRLAKAIDGPERTAAWLGDGLVAVGGFDSATTGEGASLRVQTTPFGLHVLDTRTWTYRTIDPEAEWFWSAASRLLAAGGSSRRLVGYAFDGTQRYTLDAGPDGYLQLQGSFVYACRAGWALRVYDAATGATVGTPRRQGCRTLLTGRASGF
jgi:hypothetical protein